VTKIVNIHRDVSVCREVAVEDVVFADLRLHRVTIRWFLQGQPDAQWVQAFDKTIRTEGALRSFVPSSYGTPMVLENGSIVWSVRRSDVKRSVAFVRRAIALANARATGVLVPFPAQRVGPPPTTENAR